MWAMRMWMLFCRRKFSVRQYIPTASEIDMMMKPPMVAQNIPPPMCMLLSYFCCIWLLVSEYDSTLIHSCILHNDNNSVVHTKLTELLKHVTEQALLFEIIFVPVSYNTIQESYGLCLWSWLPLVPLQAAFLCMTTVQLLTAHKLEF